MSEARMFYANSPKLDPAHNYTVIDYSKNGLARLFILCGLLNDQREELRRSRVKNAMQSV